MLPLPLPPAVPLILPPPARAGAGAAAGWGALRWAAWGPPCRRRLPQPSEMCLTWGRASSRWAAVCLCLPNCLAACGAGHWVHNMHSALLLVGWAFSSCACFVSVCLFALQVLQEVAEASDEEEPRAQQAQHAPPPPGADAPLPPEMEARRRQVLARLGGEVKAEALLQQGGQQQAGGQVAEGAGKALGGLWGWGASLAHKMEHAAASVSREFAEAAQAEGQQPPAEPHPALEASSSSGGERRAAEFRLGGMVGALGRTAQSLLEHALDAGPRWVGRRC